MPDRIWARRLTLAKWAIPLLLLLLAGTTVYVATASARVSDLDTVVVGQTRFTPGSQTALRVVVRDFKTAQPMAEASIAVRLAPRAGGAAITLFEGHTDELGTAQVTFTVPEGVDPEQTLIVETKSPLGHDKIERSVTVKRHYKIFLTTDKPLYQPGQTIHIRTLTLATADLRAAQNQPLQVTIEDPKGNKVFRGTAQTSAFGIASLDFTLADEVNTGPYKITATLDETSSQKTVTIKRYVLPKFKIEVATDKTYYLPKEEVVGNLSVNYFFGKPVAEGQVAIKGYIYTVEREQVVDLRGETDQEGRFEFRFTLPSYFVAEGLEEGQATFGLEVTVIDQANHAEQVAHTLPIAQQSILIDAVPESGQLKPGVENIVYIVTTYPDGMPAETELTIEVYGQTTQATTGRHGLAEFTFTPQLSDTVLIITARDRLGNRSYQEKPLFFDYAPEYVLLRSDRAAYRVGDTMHLETLTTAQSGTAYLDMVKEGQTISTRTLVVKEGRASVDIDLDETLFGTLQLHAYKILRDGTIVRDTRLVIVDLPRDIELTIRPDKDVYRPGEVARIAFQASKDGQPLRSALGLSIVDESVFALQEQEAGFAKLYFLLEKELLKPRYQIKGFILPTVGPPPPTEPEVLAAQDRSAKAALASAPVADFGLAVQSHVEKETIARARQQRYFGALANLFSYLMIAVPAAVGLITVVELGRRKVLGKTLLLGALGALVLIGLFALLPTPEWADWWSPWDKLGYYLGYVLQDIEGTVALGALLVAIIAPLVLAIYAWRERDEALKFALILSLAYLALVPIFLFSASQAAERFNEAHLSPLALSFLLLPLSFYVLAVGFALRKEVWPAFASGGMALFALPGLLVISAFPLMFLVGGGAGFTRAAAVPMMVPMAPVALEMVREKEYKAELPTAEPSQLQEAPRLRQFFPETLYFNPEIITDEQGFAEVEIPMADSITTWRLSALASSQDGDLGGTTAGLRVFQDFFIDLDLPLYLTQNDEVSVPVAVFNYLPEAQRVRLEVTLEDWFELQDEASKEMTIEANDVEVVYFRIKALHFGQKRLTVTAWGERPALSGTKGGAEGMSDAMAKEVKVLPDGKEIRTTASDMLQGPVQQAVLIPEEAIPGTARIEVKVYPGIVSQMVEGLQKILRMPFG
ncbi:MAG: MG2 domain-containing protein [Anaerolineae bacterium]